MMKLLKRELNLSLILMDVVSLIAVYLFTNVLIGLWGGNNSFIILTQLSVLISLKLVVNIALNIYTKYDSTGVYYFIKIAIAMIIFFATILVLRFLGIVNITIPALVNLMMLEGLMYLLSRYSQRVSIYFKSHLQNDEDSKKVLIIGNGIQAELAHREITYQTEENYKVVGFIDDDLGRVGKKFRGFPVYGPIKNLKRIAKKLEVEIIILAHPSYTKRNLEEISSVVKELNLEFRASPSIEMMLTGKGSVLSNVSGGVKDIDPKDLLNREEVPCNEEEVSSKIYGKSVLITGAGGSIGSELCKQIFKYEPKTIILFDISEEGLYFKEQDLIKIKSFTNQQTKIKAVVGSVYNADRMEYVFEKFKPEIIYHAAAYKHVPLMEMNPIEALRTNVIGTNIVCAMAHRYEAESFTLVSTDKAVRPTNVMGATKKLAEDLILYYNVTSKTKYSAVRFGNVLGSSGSMLPLFIKQIKEGGPVTITDPEIIRYFMTIPEAVGLILQSSYYTKGGEIFILDMGEQVKIKEVAEQIIRLSGYEPGIDIDIIYTGLRPGEKLYEELLLDPKSQIFTENKKIFIEKASEFRNINEIIPKVEKIVFGSRSNSEIKDAINGLVDSYTVDQRYKNA